MFSSLCVFIFVCFHLCLASVILQVHLYLKWSFTETFPSNFCCSLWGFVNQLLFRNVVPATHFRIHYQLTYTSNIHVYAMAFSAALNSLQVDEINTENYMYSRNFKQTQFIANELVATCSALVLTSEYAITLQTSTSYNLFCWTK